MASKFADALRNLEEIGSLIGSCAAAPNPKAVETIRSLCGSLGFHDSYIAEKTSKVVRLSEQYFSSRRWADHQQGADGVRAEILGNIQRLRAQIESIASKSKF